MSNTIYNLINLINQVQNVIYPLINTLNSVIGANSLYSLINCKFIGGDLENVIVAFTNNFSTSAKNLGILIVMISFFNAAMIITTIFMINYTLDLTPDSNRVSDTEMKILDGNSK